jgi:hypothetical protein
MVKLGKNFLGDERGRDITRLFSAVFLVIRMHVSHHSAGHNGTTRFMASKEAVGGSSHVKANGRN